MQNDNDRLAKIEAALDEIRAEMKAEAKETRAVLSQVLQALAKIDGRLDEQRHTLNALIPTRLAAVGDR
ncbi:MAG TPA: hypothetical protein PKZ99_10375 [Azospirillaceae bacterium]|nr:hypothetical protein [Azospirillaceae bacterium]